MPKKVWTAAARAAFAKRMAKYRKKPKRKRGKNPAKLKRCVRAVKKAARRARRKVNAYAVCTSAIRRKKTVRRRRKNTVGTIVLVARKGGQTLVYDGKFFSSRGPAHKFTNVQGARLTGVAMLKRYPVLKTYQLTVNRDS